MSRIYIDAETDESITTEFSSALETEASTTNRELSYWAAHDGSATAVAAAGDLLLENGSRVLQEDNTSFILLEGISMIPKEDSIWDNLFPKSNTAWADRYGSGIAVDVSGDLLLETGDRLLLEDNISFILLEDINMQSKETTPWDNL